MLYSWIDVVLFFFVNLVCHNLWFYQQPRPIACSSCDSNGHIECKWCGGTGFFILGDNMLCQVPSRNSTCVICAGKVKDPLMVIICFPIYVESLLYIIRMSNSRPYYLWSFQGSMSCSDCKGTGFRAKWLGEPPISK